MTAATASLKPREGTCLTSQMLFTFPLDAVDDPAALLVERTRLGGEHDQELHVSPGQAGVGL